MTTERLSLLKLTTSNMVSQVGTGIFTTPGAVLSYTKSKPVSLGLWAVGGVFTLIL
jgi:amino acid transporter